MNTLATIEHLIVAMISATVIASGMARCTWCTATRMTYPVDLPNQRVVRVDYALSWFRLRKIPVADQKVQADTYLACGLVSETINHIVDAFVRDYLI